MRQLADIFRTSGHCLYLVGGSVRDRLLGRPVHDLDLTTDANPDEIKRLVKGVRPDAVYDVGARFGTIGIIFRSPGARPAPTADEASPTGADDVVEITTFRSEQYPDGTRKPVVTFGTSLEEDLARRDFTMNAIAQEVLTGALHDPFNGMADIAKRTIRAVGDPGARFREDPLRLLRAVRFAAQLGFAIEPQTLAAIQESANDLERISTERIQEELTRILVSPRPALGLRLATALGLLARAIPEVLPMRGVSQRPLHHKDVFEHTMGVVENIPPLPVLRWACSTILASPTCKSLHDGAVHFFGHEDVGESAWPVILRRLRLDAQFVERVAWYACTCGSTPTTAPGPTRQPCVA